MGQGGGTVLYRKYVGTSLSVPAENFNNRIMTVVLKCPLIINDECDSCVLFTFCRSQTSRIGEVDWKRARLLWIWRSMWTKPCLICIRLPTLMVIPMWVLCYSTLFKWGCMSRGKMLWGIKLFDGPDKLYADITHLHHDEGGGGVTETSCCKVHCAVLTLNLHFCYSYF